MDFLKFSRIDAGLQPLFGKSISLTNGAEWQRQRRIIDPAFQSGGVKKAFPAIWTAGQPTVARLHPHVA